MIASAEPAHATVLRDEVVDGLSIKNNGVYVDGTLGWGGHAAAILQHTAARVIGIDRDPDALAAARDRLGDRIETVHGRFAELPSILESLSIPHVDGIVLDLGVSSPQLDRAERGFSFTRTGPLDMRMDPTHGPTALDLLRELDDESLANVLFELGEERHSKKIARLIKEAVVADKVHTTTELAAVVLQGIPTIEQRKSKIHPATRTFQALRIAVNRELDQLQTFLDAFPALLAPDGRCAIISFHSLEDRLVKNCFRDLAWTTSLPAHLAHQAGERVDAVCEPVTRKAVFASDDEIARNPRARSARLRVCRRTDAPVTPINAGSPGHHPASGTWRSRGRA